MIGLECFTREWIEEQGRLLGCRNQVLLEKAIVALQLVGHLVEAGLPFQFKGGTSLLLIVDPIRRLSIDADIVTQATPEQLTDALARVGQLPPFRGIEHDADRDRELPPKKHFRAKYPSRFPPEDAHVLLDVLFEPAHAAQPTLIRTPFIQIEREVLAPVPRASQLLGDKLTAFAPSTIGILEHPDRTGDVVKQLFDIGVLFDHADDLNAAAAVYETIHANQCQYRQPYTHDQTLDDTIAACLGLSWCDLRGVGRNNRIGVYLKEGVQRLQSHIVNGQFARDQSQIAAGKAACVAAWTKRRPGGITIDALRFRHDQIELLRDAQIGEPWQPLNRLKGGNPEAFHYWLRARQLLDGA